MVGVEPNSKTFTTILPACANLAALELGKEIYEKIIRRGYQFDVILVNALIDMFAKCGSINMARNTQFLWNLYVKVGRKWNHLAHVQWKSMIEASNIIV